ncbi:helix-turn-helix domain-containing protein, partial [Dietzia sp. SLG510A3-3B2-2]|nr:helix-turn-helix domain-containing protein [Dietzia sp. SLG510A3-3B2-2]
MPPRSPPSCRALPGIPGPRTVSSSLSSLPHPCRARNSTLVRNYGTVLIRARVRLRWRPRVRPARYTRPHGRAPASEVARATGLSRPTALRLLAALERNDAVER